MPETAMLADAGGSRHRAMVRRPRVQGARAAAVSFGIHAGLVGAAWLAASRLPPIAPAPAVTLVFETAPSAAPVQDFATASLTPNNTTVAAAVTHVLPTLAVSAHSAALPRRTIQTPSAARPSAALADVAPAAPVAPQARPSEGDIAGLKLRIREAVRAATVYPAVAKQMHREGRAQVQFDYVDGAAQDASLVHSSQSGLLDQAALSAVRRAAYPRPPTGLEGVRLSLQVWVNFDLKADE